MKVSGSRPPTLVSAGSPVGPAMKIGALGDANSANTWRQAPQGEAGGREPLATAAATIRRAPAATAAATALRSAQTVRP